MVGSDLGEVVERLRRSTVHIFDGRRGSGSGVIASADGRVITNAHVARSSRMRIQLWDGREFPAEIRARNPERDLAILQIGAKQLPAAEFGDSGRLRPGEVVIAVGNPLGFVGALTTGIVHSVGTLDGFGPWSWVQADIRLAPGNSGGPLADVRGRVVGINTMIAGGLALSIPSNVVDRFRREGIDRAPLGIVVRPVQVERSRYGWLILEVARGSAAERASLLPGDIITGVNGQPARSLDDLAEVLATGGSPKVQFVRGERTRIREVTIPLSAEAAAA